MNCVTSILLLRLALIGVILLIFTAGFAFAAGWLSPHRLSPADIVDFLQTNSGVHPGFRRAHAKGLCIEGTFQANGNGAALSKAQVFMPGEIPVIGRFSTGGGQPYAPDGRLVFHAIALSLTQANGEKWRMALDDTPIFIVATPLAFRDFQLATAPDPATGKPDPARTADFLAHHPETRAFMDWIREAPLPSSFANGTYYSINSFRFTNAAGETRHVRWSLVPETPFEALDKSSSRTAAGFPVRGCRRAPASGSIALAHDAHGRPAGDPLNDATKAWPADRPHLDVGTLTINRAEPEENGPCRNITFDPLILPSGISPSDDPLLPARSGVYAVSLTRRDGEPVDPSAGLEEPRDSQGLRHEARRHAVPARLAPRALVDGRPGRRHAVHRHRHGVDGVGDADLAYRPAQAARYPDPLPGRSSGVPAAHRPHAAAARRFADPGRRQRPTPRTSCSTPCCSRCRWSAGRCSQRADIRSPCSAPSICRRFGPVDPMLFAFLRRAHTLLALLLFLTILAHLGAALFHAWIRRDGVFHSMVPWR